MEVEDVPVEEPPPPPPPNKKKKRVWIREQRIRVRQENPKQPGKKSHARYEKYKCATTVGEYLWGS